MSTCVTLIPQSAAGGYVIVGSCLVVNLLGSPLEGSTSLPVGIPILPGVASSAIYSLALSLPASVKSSVRGNVETSLRYFIASVLASLFNWSLSSRYTIISISLS